MIVSKQSIDGVFLWLWWKQLCFSPLGEPSWSIWEVVFQGFDRAWCDLWENKFTFFSSWTSGFCNELGDHVYQIQACLLNSRFNRLFKHCIQWMYIESHLRLRHSARYQINETWLGPRDIHRLTLQGTHVAVTRKALQGKHLSWVLKDQCQLARQMGAKEGNQGWLTPRPRLQASGMWPPRICFDREYLKRGLTKRSSFPGAHTPLNSAKTYFTQMGSEWKWSRSVESDSLGPHGL